MDKKKKMYTCLFDDEDDGKIEFEKGENKRGDHFIRSSQCYKGICCCC